ncbi:MAG TPA: hypothetical protein VFD37_01705 [Solirubrobacterales bacterium]|nr:hypothetical protein [Solirubrobacterales bacterium]
MAQTKKKRKRKHRGTQGGRVGSGASRGKPRSRQEARAQARNRNTNRLDRPPTWRGATIRGVVAAVIFIALVILVFQRDASEALAFGGFMLLFYIPAGYYMDQMMWRRRERNRIRAAQAAQAAKATATRDAGANGKGAANGKKDGD